MAMSSKVDNHHREMHFRRYHTAPGCPTERQCTQEQHDIHTHLSSTSTETPDEHSRMSSVHEVINKSWSQVRQCLLLAVAMLFMMWQHFKAFISLWCSISCQGHSKKKRNLSVNAEVDMLSYCSKKWKGEALNAKKMRKAYEDVYWKHNIKTLQPVKEDNYCMLRAVMFQVFSQAIPFPGWMKEKDILKIPEKLLYSQGCNWIQQFSFGPEKYAGTKVYGKLRSCLEVFKNEAELCLVGYALEVKIKVLQLTKVNTEDFEIIYPADHKRDWHEITLITDDDGHYNIPIIAK